MINRHDVRDILDLAIGLSFGFAFLAFGVFAFFGAFGLR